MESLLSISKINERKLKELIKNKVGYELSSLSEPCYYPSLKAFYYELLHACGLTETDLKKFIKNYFAGSKAEGFKTQVTPMVNLLVFLMYYFLKKEDHLYFSYVMIIFHILEYSNRMFKMIRYCNKDVFKYTFEVMSKSHLFIREKTIGNALYFLSQENIKKYKELLRDPHDVMEMAKFIYAARHRINQSCRSFAVAYYQASKDGIKFSSPVDYNETDEEDQRSQERDLASPKIVEDTVKKITIYKVVDPKIVDYGKNITKINRNIALDIARHLSNTEFGDDIREILILFLKDLKNVSNVCNDKKFLDLVKNLMGLKRTIQKVYFKQKVGELLKKVLIEMEYYDKFQTMTGQTQYLISLYLAIYLTSVMRYYVCGD